MKQTYTDKLDAYTEQKLLLQRQVSSYREKLDSIFGILRSKGRMPTGEDVTDEQMAELREYHKKFGIKVHDVPSLHRGFERLIDGLGDHLKAHFGASYPAVLNGEIRENIAPFREFCTGLERLIASRLSMPLADLHTFDVVVWSKDMWEMGSNAQGLEGDVVLTPKMFPAKPQIWFAEEDFRTQIGVSVAGSYRSDSGEPSEEYMTLKAIALYPAPIAFSEIYPEQTAWCYAVIGTLPSGSTYVSFAPLVQIDKEGDVDQYLLNTFYTSAIYGNMTDDLVAKVTSMLMKSEPKVKDGQLQMYITNSDTARAICAAMLFMQESYVGTKVRTLRGEGLIRRAGSAQKVKHTSTVHHVELRRPLRRETGKSQSGRVYTHQWLVRGHWRHYKEPTREGKTLVRIADYWKGPEGAPIKKRDVIITVSR